MGMPPNPGLAGAAGGGANPLAAALGALQNRTQSPGQSLSQQSSELQGSDPTMILRQLESVNQVLGVLFVKSFQAFPNVANQISSTMKQLSRAIKEAQQGANVSEVVGKSEEATSGAPPPITFGPVMTGSSQIPSSGIPAT